MLALPLVGASGVFCSCNDWLNLLPNNEQVTEEYWQSKEDVENVLASGYVYMRNSVPTLINWGELRGGDFYNDKTGSSASKLMDFDLLPTNNLCKYATLYQVISVANSVLEKAPEVRDIDNTYYESMMKSHLCEAYFQRAWAYSILVKNFKEVPLVVDAFMSDKVNMSLPKNSESEIIAQIKSDVYAAVELGAAKGHYEEDWQTKSRATKWALYALMADICLWNHDYDECIVYANKILEATDAFRPVFIQESSNWFQMFNPGLSNESIFELYWDYNTENSNNNFTGKFATKDGGIAGSENGICNFTNYAMQKMGNETARVLLNNKEMTTESRVGRMLNASYTAQKASFTSSGWTLASPALWKYLGSEGDDLYNPRVHSDANFILYRVADVILMKAEALVMKGEGSWRSAIELINKIRVRACLPVYVDLEADDVDAVIQSLDQYTLLTEILDQREMEFLGEAHRWYDILRLARYDRQFAPNGIVEDNMDVTPESYATVGFGEDAFKYKQKALSIVVESNMTNSDDQIKSILNNSWAWYLPLPQSDIDCNPNLKQNPYYN